MRFNKWRFAVCLPALLAAACGGAAAGADGITETPVAVAQQQVDEEPTPDPEVPRVIDNVSRGELDELLELGPAHILAMVQTDSRKEKGRFVGFEIISFRFDAKSVLGLKEGDVVTRVNGLPIERPEQYFAVFEKLKTAEEISFQIVRDGQQQNLTAPVRP